MKQRGSFWKNKIDKHLERLTKKIKIEYQKKKMIGKAATKTTEVQTNHKKILWIVIYQQIEQPRKNGHISINIYPAKTESKRNWTFEQKDDLKINRICKEKKKKEIQGGGEIRMAE